MKAKIIKPYPKHRVYRYKNKPWRLEFSPNVIHSITPKTGQYIVELQNRLEAAENKMKDMDFLLANMPEKGKTLLLENQTLQKKLALFSKANSSTCFSRASIDSKSDFSITSICSFR